MIKETLRVRPVVMEVGRDLTEDARIGPWELPAGTLVPLPHGGRVTPLLLRYAGGVQEDMRILGGVPPRAAVAF